MLGFLEVLGSSVCIDVCQVIFVRSLTVSFSTSTSTLPLFHLVFCFSNECLVSSEVVNLGNRPPLLIKVIFDTQVL
jgi:hypothetical protein